MKICSLFFIFEDKELLVENNELFIQRRFLEPTKVRGELTRMVGTTNIHLICILDACTTNIHLCSYVFQTLHIFCVRFYEATKNKNFNYYYNLHSG